MVEKKKNPLTISIHTIEMNPIFTLQELCEACHTTPDFIESVIEFGVIEPEKNHFNAMHLQRIRKILQLQHDLEVNLAGAALAIELTEQMDRLRQRVAWLEKHWGGI